MIRFQSPPSISQKFRKTKPLQAPQRGPLWRDMPISRAYFNTSLQFFIKILVTKEILLFSQRPQERNVPPCSPNTWPLWKQTLISRALLSISFGGPSKGALPSVSPYRAPTERNAPFLESSFNHLSKSLVNAPPFRFHKTRSLSASLGGENILK
jgi:hypothetical protein